MTRSLALALIGLVAGSGVSLTSASAESEGEAAARPQACTVDAPRLPRTVHVDADLASRVEALISRSATFRQQCRRLADASSRVFVSVRLNPLIMAHRYRARSVIRRYESGAIVANVELAPARDLAEWFGHEFEHVIEQIDGVRVVQDAGLRRGAWRSGDQTYETRRAILAGRAVLREMHTTIMSNDAKKATRLSAFFNRPNAFPAAYGRKPEHFCLAPGVESGLLTLVRERHGVDHGREMDGASRGACW